MTTAETRETPWMTLAEVIVYARTSRRSLMRAIADYRRHGDRGLRTRQPRANAKHKFHVNDVDRWVNGEPPARTSRKTS